MSAETAAPRPVAPNPVAAWVVPLAVLIIAALAIAGWTLMPVLAVGDAGNDALFLADGARRMAAGQWPHIDFSLPTGALPFLLYWAGQAWLPSLPAFMAMQILGFLVISPFLILATAHMPSLWARLALTVAVAITAILPFNTTGFEFCTPDLFASYNRLGAAFSLAFLAWIFQARAGRGIALNAVVIAAALLIAVSIKVVYAGVVLAPLGVLFLFDGRWRVIALAAGAAVLLVLGAIELTTGLVRAYLADVMSMSSVNSQFAKYFLGSFVFKHMFPLALAGALVVLMLWRALRRPGMATLLERAAHAVAPLVMGAGLLAVLVSESQSTGGMGLTAALALVFAPGVFSPQAPRVQLVLASGIAVMLGGGLLSNGIQRGYCSLMERNGDNIATAWSQDFLPYAVIPAKAAQFAEASAQMWEHLSPAEQELQSRMMDPPDDIRYLTEWKTVHDAIAVLHARGLDHDLGRTTTISFVDMFGLALQTAAPRGIKVVPVIERTIAQLSDAEASAYLADADTVFQPTCGVTQGRPGFRLDAWFLATLDTQFTPTPLTNCWTMYRRKTS